jgi:hypothetical protein
VTDLEQAINDAVEDTFIEENLKPFPIPKTNGSRTGPSVAEQLLTVAASIRDIHGEIDAMQADFKKRLMDLNEEVDRRLMAIRKNMGSRA